MDKICGNCESYRDCAAPWHFDEDGGGNCLHPRKIIGIAIKFNDTCLLFAERTVTISLPLSIWKTLRSLMNTGYAEINGGYPSDFEDQPMDEDAIAIIEFEKFVPYRQSSLK